MQGIARMNNQARRIELLFQTLDQVAVEFNHMQLLQRLQQQARHGSQAGTDLDHRIIRLRVDGADDVVKYALVGQEVLAETLAWNVFHEFRFLLRRAPSAQRP